MNGRLTRLSVPHEGRLYEGASMGAAWHVFADQDAVFHPDFASVVRTAALRRPDIDVFYGDEVVLGHESGHPLYLCKPTFDRIQLIAQDYVGLPVVISAKAMLALGGLDEVAGSASVFDLLLRALAAGFAIERITQVLAANPINGFRASVSDRLAALRRHFQAAHDEVEITQGTTEEALRLERRFRVYPEVTILVPTAQTTCAVGSDAFRGRPMILNFLDALGITDWPIDRMRVLIGDDVEDDSAYKPWSWPFHIDRIITAREPDGKFNYARKVNEIWRCSRGEYLVIMNDDIMIRYPDWLRALMTFAMDGSVGGVGARLLYPDEMLQHVGVPMGVHGICTHAFIGYPAKQLTYQNWAEVHREWSAVTGAVFATRRSVLEQINGFDERFSLDYNDIDLCLRLRMLGYRIVYTPHAEMTHLESASRGKRKSPGSETALFMERWRSVIEDDPYYHPRLTRRTSDIEPVMDVGDWWSGIVPVRTSLAQKTVG